MRQYLVQNPAFAHGTTVQHVEIEVDGSVIVLQQLRQLQIDGKFQSLPFSRPGQTFSEQELSNKQYLVATFDFGLQVWWSGSMTARYSLSKNFSSQVCGMCGNFDGLLCLFFINL